MTLPPVLAPPVAVELAPDEVFVADDPFEEDEPDEDPSELDDAAFDLLLLL